MCNLYSITTNQAAIIALFRVMNRYVGNLPPIPGVFPDYPAPVVRSVGAERELNRNVVREFDPLADGTAAPPRIAPRAAASTKNSITKTERPRSANLLQMPRGLMCKPRQGGRSCGGPHPAGSRRIDPS
jgi:hypothetical protein